jgi:3-hydroxybutyryl-CoA dehydratase
MTFALGRTVDELTVGDRASVSKIVSETDIHLYIGMTGDLNPLYTDESYAATQRYHERVAPGALTAGLVVAVISTRLPGPGTILEREDLHFTAPVRPGDTITAFAEVVEVIASRGRVRLSTVCKNQDGEVVLEGEVVVLPPPQIQPAIAGQNSQR